MGKKIKIYIATHKKFNPPESEIYIPIRVGSILNDDDFGYIRDDTKENISVKNKNYCELTALYWIWKNDKSDIVGLVHYRRYFFKNIMSNKIKNILDEEEIGNIFNKYDVIVPNKTFIIKHNVEKSWRATHLKKDYDLCREVIKEKHPDYLNAFDSFSKSKKLYICNMIIAKKEYFNNYCEWLFDILFELEKKIDLSNYDEYNKRIFGFLSERLLNVWLYKNKDLKIKQKVVYNIDRFPHNQYFMIN